MSDKPTEAQIKEFWEWCGFGFAVFRGDAKLWTKFPDGNYVDTEFELGAMPCIDLNNLFKYEPLTARGYHICTDTYKREVNGVMGQCSWVTIKDSDGKVVACHTAKELEDALFWAIREVIHNE